MIEAVPYFTFRNSLQVLEFYEQKLGAKVLGKVMGNNEMFKDMPDAMKMPNDVAEKFVMNAAFELLGRQFMVSDSWGNEAVDNSGAQVCFTFDGSNETERAKIVEFFDRAVQAGCKVTMPLGKTPWSSLYGTFVDPYDITWMVNAY